MSERRAVVTENVRDFAVAHRWSFDSGATHYGMIFTQRSGVVRARHSSGTLVRALEDFLEAHPADDDLRDQTHWLSPARA